MNTTKDFRFEFQTPVPVAKYMVDMIPFNGSCKSALEPTPGMGTIVEKLLDADFFVHAPTNFFDIEMSAKYDCIVMNPPFSLKYAFGVPNNVTETGMRLGYYILTECMKMSDYVIALMPWFTISDSDVRLRFLKEYGIKSLTALPRKTFQYARIQTVVIELKKDYTGETIFKTFNF
ncbi:MAG TPA: hypothetical protein VIK29_10275 [Paludibacter sp.]